MLRPVNARGLGPRGARRGRTSGGGRVGVRRETTLAGRNETWVRRTTATVGESAAGANRSDRAQTETAALCGSRSLRMISKRATATPGLGLLGRLAVSAPLRVQESGPDSEDPVATLGGSSRGSGVAPGRVPQIQVRPKLRSRPRRPRTRSRSRRPANHWGVTGLLCHAAPCSDVALHFRFRPGRQSYLRKTPLSPREPGRRRDEGPTCHRIFVGDHPRDREEAHSPRVPCRPDSRPSPCLSRK